MSSFWRFVLPVKHLFSREITPEKKLKKRGESTVSYSNKYDKPVVKYFGVRKPAVQYFGDRRQQNRRFIHESRTNKAGTALPTHSSGIDLIEEVGDNRKTN